MSGKRKAEKLVDLKAYWADLRADCWVDLMENMMVERLVEMMVQGMVDLKAGHWVDLTAFDSSTVESSTTNTLSTCI